MSAVKHLAEVLRKAQGRTDAETGQQIDVGYEVAQLSAEIRRLREIEKKAISATTCLASQVPTYLEELEAALNKTPNGLAKRQP